MAPMSHGTVDSAPATSLAPSGPGPAVVLSLIALAAAWHLLAARLLPFAVMGDIGLSSWWAWGALAQTAWIAYAVGLLIVARSRRRRIAALAVVAAGITVDVLSMLAFRHLGDHPDFLISLSRVAPYLLAGLAVAAWGVARRTGPWWPMGLLVTLGIIAFLHSDTGLNAYLDLISTIEAWLGAPTNGQGVVHTTLRWLLGWFLPILAGGLACWRIETYVRRSSGARA